MIQPEYPTGCLLPSIAADCPVFDPKQFSGTPGGNPRAVTIAHEEFFIY
jgi:hypothetical protein